MIDRASAVSIIIRPLTCTHAGNTVCDGFSHIGLAFTAPQLAARVQHDLFYGPGTVAGEYIMF